ncbi:MAG: radical SAM protein [Roseburia sp. CAG:10041_57]|jgi:organic radical activating enzyme|nr:MAG: radical SAM protein [Roseburia sp. CAG:10041_57]
MNILLKRTVLNVTTYCNLKCKHCLAFIPYYKNPNNLSLEDAKKIMESYFEIVDSVEHFTITGGEPLLNPQVKEICEETTKYLDRITENLDFVTNGTIELPDGLLEVFGQNKKMRVILSNYGNDLSKKFELNEQKLNERNINYRVSKFYGDSLYYDGWIDFTDQSLKWKTEQERNNNAKGCLHRVGKYFIINDAELHSCSRSYWRMKNNIIPKVLGEYVPLIDEAYSIEEKKKYLIEMCNKQSSSSCAYCVGFRNDVPRVYPAQQLKS